MPISKETLQEIDGFVRGGFENREHIIVIFCEEMYEPGELDPAEVTAAVDAAIAVHEREKATWPSKTDCDRLDAVFESLNKQGIIAIQNAGYTQSDGYDDVREEFANDTNPKTVVGYCYYHGQDLERAVHGGGLFLSFGPMDPSKEKTEGPRIGKLIVEELEDAKFEVEWNGTFDKRIFIPKIDWKRR